MTALSFVLFLAACGETTPTTDAAVAPKQEKAEKAEKAKGGKAKAEPAPVDALSEAEAGRKQELASLLAAHAGNVSAVARAMGKARMQVQRWMKRYGLDPRQFKR